MAEAGKVDKQGVRRGGGGGNFTLLCDSLSKTLIHTIPPLHLFQIISNTDKTRMYSEAWEWAGESEETYQWSN